MNEIIDSLQVVEEVASSGCSGAIVITVIVVILIVGLLTLIFD